MNKIWILLLLLCPVLGYSQQGNFVTEAEYQLRKTQGTLLGDEILLSNGMVNPNDLEGGVNFVKHFNIEKATGCAQYFAPPGPAYNISWSTDDGSAPIINLPFTFCFFGDSYNSVYMNNNGNISFQNSISSFSSSAFPSTGNKMIAAFWADFDFGSCGTMHCTVTPTAAIFNWVNAGYFSSQCDKKNTCQIVITNGFDPLVISGNCAIHYDDMNWTTGSASSGISGFGGTPATAGANRGNNLDYFQIGRFDHAGSDYDGPNGINDGVDFLDHKSYFFDFCNVTSGNLSPIPIQSNACDTFSVCHSADTIVISFPFIGPENNQITSVSYTAPTLSNVQVLSNTSGYTGNLTLQIIGSQQTVGVHDIVVTGTDNFSTPGSTTVTYKLEVTDPALAFPIIPIITYTPGCAPVAVSISNTTYDGFLWSNGGTDSSTLINTSFNGNLAVQVTNGGCTMDLDTTIYIPGTPFFNMQGSMFYCPDNLTTHLFLPDSNALDSAHWMSGSTILNTNFSANLGAGTYHVTIWDSTSLCSADTIFTVISQPNLVLENDKFICANTYTFTANVGGIGSGTWSVLGSPTPAPTFFNNNLNTQVTLPNHNTFSLIYTENGCQDKDTVEITWEDTPIFGLDTNLFACPGLQKHLEVADSLIMGGISWGFANLALDTLYSANFNPGTYTATLSSAHGCTKDTTFTISTQQPIQINYFDKWCGDSVEMHSNTGIQEGIWSCYNCPGAVIYRHQDSLNTGMHISAFGTYNLIFTESTCNDDDTLTIKFIPNPYVDLINYKICAGYNQEILSNIYEPNFVDNLIWSTNATTPTITVNTEGIYSLTASNYCGTYTDSSIITVKVCDIEVPNTFTTNGDGVNDVFKLTTSDLDFFKTFNITIVNRWGNIVASFDQATFNWDGKNPNGTLVETGVYFYTIKSTTIENEELNKQGFIQIFTEK
ncbi:MAG: gliding motility-associated C-terminal domain-containing protein [Flavobacteriia bacterium]|nr:gliding motility-associated C-terminal domain-containing protein [Flavobacteriia bacterium]